VKSSEAPHGVFLHFLAHFIKLETACLCLQDHENVRDLTKLNRDLSKVIFIVSESHKKNVVPAENVLVIPDFMPPDSDAPQPEQDTTLLDLVPLLELVWKQDVPDTRVVCRSYAGKDVVSEFRRRASAEAAAQSRQSRLSPRLRFGFG
jgi:TFIIF-interacting CTD phosphatase-like protein